MLLSGPRKKLLITGAPGTGKTTLLKKLAYWLIENGFSVKGFFTEEVRKKGKRQGFIIKLFSKEKSFWLAKREKGSPRVGSYRVFVENLDQAILELKKDLINSTDKTLWFIDEIGKMELLSQNFKTFINELVNSQLVLVSTIAESKVDFIERLKNREDVVLCRINPENRNFVFERLKVEFVRKGKLIVIEGIDGSGKTTVIRSLENTLKELKLPVKVSQEPTNGPFGRKLRELLKVGGSANEILELFLKDREEHIKNEVIPELNKGTWLILDRYYLSTVAYQGAQGFSIKELLTKNETIAPIPDMVVFLDISVKDALKRITCRGNEKTIFEKEDFLKKVKAIYEKILTKFCCIKVDATNSISEITKRVLEGLSPPKPFNPS